jgi:hypothetical protein
LVVGFLDKLASLAFVYLTSVLHLMSAHMLPNCSVLNKLTVEKFETLVPQLLAVGISSENALKGIILLIFDKAVDEPSFSSMYARVCERLSQDGTWPVSP